MCPFILFTVDGGHIAFNVLTLRVSALLCLVSACAGSLSERTTAARRATPSDVVATVLAAQLPAGASACAVAQPRWVEPARRPLMLPLTAIDPFVWKHSTVIDAYAEAQQRDRNGPGAQVRLIRFRGELAQLRAEIAQNARFDVRWDEPPSMCTPDHCVVSARLIGEHLVRLDRGLWRERVPGAESRCAALVREHPHAAEISIRGPLDMAFSQGLVPLVASSTRIETRAQRIRLTQRDRMDSVEAAQILAETNEDFLHERVGVIGRTERTRHGAVVTSVTELTWDDLQNAIDDRDRDVRNRRYAELILALEPADGVDPRQLSHALEQLRLRLTLLDHPPVSATLLTSTVELAERIYAANPDSDDSAYLLATLYVQHANQPDKAQPLADRHATRDANTHRWTSLDLSPRTETP